MQRPIIITIGIVIILLVLGVWVYLLLYGTPKETNEVFSNLGFEFTPQSVAVVEENNLNQNKFVALSGEPLQQLTTKPVAGFTDIAIASSTYVRYVEQGTGHVYDINLETGEETIVSRTTIPKTQEATFSESGENLVITSILEQGSDSILGEIDISAEKINSLNLPPDAENITFTKDSTVEYTLKTDSGTGHYEHDLSNQMNLLTSLPFDQTVMIKNEEETWFYNKPAMDLPGYLYKKSGSSIISTDITGFGLTALAANNSLAYNHYREDKHYTNIFSLTDSETSSGPITMLPEKCSSLTKNNTAVCAAPATRQFNIEDWYKGEEILNDMIWSINLTFAGATVIEDFAETGRSIDVNKLQTSKNGDFILFRNKIDGTLWRYEI